MWVRISKMKSNNNMNMCPAIPIMNPWATIVVHDSYVHTYVYIHMHVCMLFRRELPHHKTHVINYILISILPIQCMLYIVGPMFLTPVFDTWWHLSWVSKLGLIPYLHASSPACNGFLRFTSGGTPANFLMAILVAKPLFLSTSLHT